MSSAMIKPEEVCYVPDELIEEGQERKLQKVSKFNDVAIREEENSVDDDFDFAQETIRETIMKSNEVLQELLHLLVQELGAPQILRLYLMAQTQSN